MPMEKKFKKKELKAAVDRYFNSISRIKRMTERRDTGKKDSYGHPIYEQVPITNELGEQVEILEYLVPPTLGGLCLYLGIVSSTWSRWRDAEKYPEYARIIEYVDDRILAWCKEQVLVRKDVKGIIWNLEVNHGCVKKDAQQEATTIILEEGIGIYAG